MQSKLGSVRGEDKNEKRQTLCFAQKSPAHAKPTLDVSEVYALARLSRSFLNTLPVSSRPFRSLTNRRFEVEELSLVRTGVL